MKTIQLLSAVFLGCWAWAAAQGNGEIIFLSGNVSLSNPSGGIRIPAMGARVNPGDTLTTGRDSAVHLRMDDAALLALRPNSRLKIEAYSAQGVAADKVELRLYSGSVRSVAGWIGRDYPEHYVVHALGTYIGVRGGCDHEPLVVSDGPGTGVFDRVNCGESVLESRYGRVLVPNGNAAFSPARGESGPELLPSIPARYAASRHEALIEAEKAELEHRRDQILKQRREESAKKGIERDGKARIGSLDDARLARLALDEMLRAYEKGDSNWIRNRLDPSLIGYQKFLDDMETENRLCKQMQIHLLDTQVQAAPDIAIVQSGWEKRCSLLPDYKPVLITGQSAFLMHKNNNVWSLVQFGSGNQTPACAARGNFLVCTSTGSPFVTSAESLSRTYAYTPGASGNSGNSGIGGALGSLTANGPALTSCPAISAAALTTPLAANLVVNDPDRAGALSLAVVISNSQGERETLSLTPATVGGSQFVLAAGALPVRNQFPVQNNGVIEQRPVGASCIPWTVTYSDPLTPSGPQDVFVVVGP